MIVKELIEKLQSLPQDAIVVVSGYEGGVNEVGDATECNLELNVHTDWYYGAHEITDNEGGVVGVYLG